MLQVFSTETDCRCGFPRGNCILWHSQSCHTDHVHLWTHLGVGSKSGADQAFPFSSYFCTAWNAVMWGLWGLIHAGKFSLIHTSFTVVFPSTCGYSGLLSRNLFCTALECPNVILNSGCLWSSLNWSGLAKGSRDFTVGPRLFMTKLVQALLSIIDREHMEKAIWKNGKVNIHFFF